MLELTPLHGAGALAALAAGATGSVHCAVMCGPLACAALPAADGVARRAALAPMAAWHAGRVAAYALVGGALGAAGGGLAALLAARVQPVLPWVMAVGFAASAFDLSRRLPTWPASLARVSHSLVRLGAAARGALRALLLGAATPLLPCGLLWGMFLAAVGAGSAVGGALVLGLFAVGGTPGLAAVQAGARWFARWPRLARALRVGVPLAAAALLVLRAWGAGDPRAGGGHHH